MFVSKMVPSVKKQIQTANTSFVMRLAWSFVKQSSCTLSEGMASAWVEYHKYKTLIDTNEFLDFIVNDKEATVVSYNINGTCETPKAKTKAKSIKKDRKASPKAKAESIKPVTPSSGGTKMQDIRYISQKNQSGVLIINNTKETESLNTMGYPVSESDAPEKKHLVGSMEWLYEQFFGTKDSVYGNMYFQACNRLPHLTKDEIQDMIQEFCILYVGSDNDADLKEKSTVKYPTHLQARNLAERCKNRTVKKYLARYNNHVVSEVEELDRTMIDGIFANTSVKNYLDSISTIHETYPELVYTMQDKCTSMVANENHAKAYIKNKFNQHLERYASELVDRKLLEKQSQEQGFEYTEDGTFQDKYGKDHTGYKASTKQVSTFKSKKRVSQKWYGSNAYAKRNTSINPSACVPMIMQGSDGEFNILDTIQETPYENDLVDSLMEAKTVFGKAFELMASASLETTKGKQATRKEQANILEAYTKGQFTTKNRHKELATKYGTSTSHIKNSLYRGLGYLKNEYLELAQQQTGITIDTDLYQMLNHNDKKVFALLESQI